MDYNIYIHDLTSKVNPTKPTPNKQQPVTPKIPELKEDDDGFLISGLLKGAGGKIAISIAAVTTAFKISNKVISTVEPFVTRASGDFRFRTAMSNINNSLNILFNPIGTSLAILENQQRISLSNQRLEQERVLLGDATISSWGGRTI